MALIYSEAVNKARLDSIESTISPASAAAFLKVYSGSPPSTIATAASGTMLVNIALPADWMSAAGGTQPNVNKAKLGVWSATGAAVVAGTVGYFRITAADGTTAGIQGLAAQGGGELSFDNGTLTAGQTVTVNSFTLTAANQG
jgi:hypothetical protein